MRCLLMLALLQIYSYLKLTNAHFMYINNEAKCTLINYSKSRVVLPSTNVETDMHRKIKAKDLNAMFSLDLF